MVRTLQGENVLPTLSQVLPTLDESSAQPLYQQLQRALRGAIENGIIGPDDALPPERDLAEMLKVSRITVRKAIDELVEDGLLIRKQGSGTFVSNRVEKNFAKLTSFSEDMRARGRQPRSVWLNRAEGTVTPEESLTLRSSPGTPVYRFHRIRYADDAPMAIEYATVLRDCLSSLDAVADESARSLLADQQTFFDQFVHGLAHGDARHRKHLGEIALGRQRVVRADDTVLDGFAQGALKLLIERLGARFIELR